MRRKSMSLWDDDMFSMYGDFDDERPSRKRRSRDDDYPTMKDAFDATVGLVGVGIIGSVGLGVVRSIGRR